MRVIDEYPGLVPRQLDSLLSRDDVHQLHYHFRAYVAVDVGKADKDRRVGSRLRHRGIKHDNRARAEPRLGE